jgi:hypothetical protein
MSQPEQDAPSSWHEEVALGPVYFGRHNRSVTVRSHIAEERYTGRGSETLFTLTEREGLHTSIQSEFRTPALPRPQRVATAQAWYYPADRTVVLWELLLEPSVRRLADPPEDLLLRSLWRHYETLLLARFPDTERLLTTWEDDYDRDAWVQFLTALGYHKTGPATFARAL